jgi:hypothetical protein
MDDNQALILPVFYLGNIQYWSKLVHQKNIIFNDIENYPKGSFRNRCYIVSSQGLLRLSIPLVGGKHAGQKYTEVKIDQQENWQKKHWQSINSCYGSAPFFHHYGEKLHAIYERPVLNLWDWNLKLTKMILSMLPIELPDIRFLSDGEVSEPNLDLSPFFSPKPRFILTDETWINIEYPQVFENNLGFIPNASILDLIFCQGPYALNVLRKSFLSAKQGDLSNF